MRVTGLLLSVSCLLVWGCPPVVVPPDLCDGVTCEDGETCVEGVCVPDADPCDDVTCGDGETCVDGECVAGDLCADVTCDDGFECDAATGECVGAACESAEDCDDADACTTNACVNDGCVFAEVACDDDGDACTTEVCNADTGECESSPVECADGETCVDGECEPDGGTTEKTYVGSESCMPCHSEIYGWFRNSGHPYKVNEVIDGMAPEYPFSTIEGALEMIDDDDQPGPDEGDAADPNLGGTDNALGTPQSYDDVSFVIGGYGWKSRWMDADGFIVTGSAVQYNLETESMSAYHNNEQGKKFNCGNCHTTGWRRYTSEEGDDRNLNRQNDLPGIDGTFAFTGIQCESCHGAGSAHVASLSKDDITRIAEPRTTEDFLADDMAYGLPVACSECHVRESEKDYPTYEGGPGRILASGGLIRHHEQYEEMIGINPDDVDAGPVGAHAMLTCLTCHDPHTTTRYQAISGDPPGVIAACTDCHAADEYEVDHGDGDVTCTDCHMPLLAKSAIKHDAVGTGPAYGDIASHIFGIDLSAENQFTEDGKYAYPWITGSFACGICHNGESAPSIDFPSDAITIHGN